MKDPRTGKEIPLKFQLTSLRNVHPNCCIYLVPENVRQINEDAYRPWLVSIGPVYYNDPRLTDMWHQKLRYLQSFLIRYPKYNIDEYLSITKGWEQSARKSYIETINLPQSSTVFVEMLLLDAAFIIELFMRIHSYKQNDPVIRVGLDDRIFNKPRVIMYIIRDLRLEENQLPFFIIKDLYKIAIESSSQHPHPSMFHIACGGFEIEHLPQGINLDGIKHLLDLLRECHLPTKRRDQSSINKPKFEFTSSVTKLSEAGVKFKAAAKYGNNLLDIRFSKGVLEIPKLKVTDDTESLFRNIMVFEQCHHFYDSYIIDYFALLNSLINTPEDVEILVKTGIIESWLGNNQEVANMFSNLFKEIRLRDANFYYSGICGELNAFAKTRWHRWRAILKSKYFNHPWAIVAVFYAIFLLILTVLQVVTGFISIK